MSLTVSNISTSDRPRFAGPLYSQVRDAIRDRILAGEWAPGEPFPNEIKLARDLSVSVGTMRKALSILEDEHLIVRQQGKGTFVADSASDSRFPPIPVLHIDGRPVNVSITQTGMAIGEATAEEAHHLEIGEDDDVVRLSRCYRNRKQVLAFETLIVPVARFPGLENITELTSPTLFSVYQRKYGVAVSTTEECVYVGEMADLPDQPEFAASTQNPRLCISRVAFDAQANRLEWSILRVWNQGAKLCRLTKAS